MAGNILDILDGTIMPSCLGFVNTNDSYNGDFSIIFPVTLPLSSVISVGLDVGDDEVGGGG
jgi:hypothetical protein